jgi:hypothetical protein
MLREMGPVRQVAGEPSRRWFADRAFDLIVWSDARGDLTGFQLCYRKGSDEHALTWWRETGFSHDRIDDGEGLPENHKMTPILVPDGSFDRDQLVASFRRVSQGLDPELVGFVASTIARYPGNGG